MIAFLRLLAAIPFLTVATMLGVTMRVLNALSACALRSGLAVLRIGDRVSGANVLPSREHDHG